MVRRSATMSSREKKEKERISQGKSIFSSFSLSLFHTVMLHRTAFWTQWKGDHELQKKRKRGLDHTVAEEKNIDKMKGRNEAMQDRRLLCYPYPTSVKARSAMATMWAHSPRKERADKLPVFGYSIKSTQRTDNLWRWSSMALEGREGKKRTGEKKNEKLF